MTQQPTARGATAEGPAVGAPQPPSDPTGGLNLSDLERIALENNPTLVQARMAIQAAEGGYVQAGLYPNPTVGYLADEIGNDGSEGLQGALVGQEIVTASKLQWGRSVAAQEIAQARCALAIQQWRIVNDVRAGYYEVLLFQKMIAVAQQALEISEEALGYTQRLREALEVSEAAVLESRVEASRARLGLKQAEYRHRAAWRRLATVLGQPEMEAVTLVGDIEHDLPEFAWEDVLNRVLTESPELGRALAGVQRARSELARQCAERRPNFEVGAAVKYDTGSRFTVADLELSVPLPLFNRNQGNIMRAQAELIAAERELQRVELDLQSRLAAAFEQYSSARERAECYAEEILPNARASLDLISKGYREGEFGVLELLIAQRTYFDANLEYLDSLMQFWARTVELEGLLLRGGLDEVAVPEPSGD